VDTTKVVVPPEPPKHVNITKTFSATGGVSIDEDDMAIFVDYLEAFARLKYIEKTCIIIDGKPVDAMRIFISDSALLAEKYRATVAAKVVINGR